MPRRSIRLAAPLSMAAVELAVARIDAMTIQELRAEWRAVHKASSPPGLSKDVMARELAYHLQRRALGGLPQDLNRLLRSLARGEEPNRRIKTGSIIVREHQGAVHEVLVVPGGFSWRGKTYASLSTIAKLITGVSWNGPRFFGLRAKRAGPVEAAAGGVPDPTRETHTVAAGRGRRSSVGAPRPLVRVPATSRSAERGASP